MDLSKRGRTGSIVVYVRSGLKRGKKGALEMLPETYNLGTLFVGAYPQRAWREPE